MITRTLPEECIANIISCTSPRDACRLSLVSRAFESAATSNLVWERFLPPDYQEIISSSSSSSSSLNMLTKKNLYFHLCDNPILIGNSNMSFQIDKLSGKKCLMLAARALSILWISGDSPHNLKWISSTESPVLPKSRFSKVAHLRNYCLLDMIGRIETKVLSPKTKYGAYFIYSMVKSFYINHYPVKVSIRLENEVEEGDATNAYLSPKEGFGAHRRQLNEEFLRLCRQVGQLPIEREDLWMEIEIGEFFNGSQVDDHAGEVKMFLKDVQVVNWISGIVVHGIELRPKEES